MASDPPTGSVIAGGEAGQIYRVHLDDPQPEVVAQARGFVLDVAVNGKGRIVACVTGDRAGVGEIRAVISGEPDLYRPVTVLEIVDTFTLPDEAVVGEPAAGTLTLVAPAPVASTSRSTPATRRWRRRRRR